MICAVNRYAEWGTIELRQMEKLKFKLTHRIDKTIFGFVLQTSALCFGLNHRFVQTQNRRKVGPNMVNWPKCPPAPNWIPALRSWISVRLWSRSTDPTDCHSATVPGRWMATMSSDLGMGASPITTDETKLELFTSNTKRERHGWRRAHAYLFLGNVIAQRFFNVITFLGADSWVLRRRIIHNHIPNDR